MVTIPKPSKIKKKKVKKPTLSKLRKILDRKWFETIYLRDKGTCQKCGRKDTLAGHHIFGKKAYPAGRWLLDNGILLCYGCHIHFAHGKPYDFEDWMKTRDIRGTTYSQREDFWINTFLKVKKVSQFRSCDFDKIKGELENEKAKIVAGRVDMSKDPSCSKKI